MPYIKTPWEFSIQSNAFFIAVDLVLLLTHNRLRLHFDGSRRGFSISI